MGRRREDLYPKIDAIHDEICLDVKNLSVPGVKEVSFTLKKDEILGVSGLMGAGRTELMKAVYGAAPRTSGEITLHNKVINPIIPKTASPTALR